MSALFLMAALAAAPAADGDSLKAVKEHLAANPSVKADFVQVRKWVALKDTLQSSGTVAFDRSGKLCGKRSSRLKTELTLEGSTATMKVPKLKSTQTFDLKADPGMAAVFDSLRAVIRADFAELEKDFDVVTKAGKTLSVKLTPRNDALKSVVSAINLTFNEKLDLANVLLEEAGGDSTEISFSHHTSS